MSGLSGVEVEMKKGQLTLCSNRDLSQVCRFCETEEDHDERTIDYHEPSILYFVKIKWQVRRNGSVGFCGRKTA